MNSSTYMQASTTTMKRLKHSKYRNTGLIFELLAKKLVTESMDKKKGLLKALPIIVKYFGRNKILAEELKQYTVLTSQGLDKAVATKLISEVLQQRTHQDKIKIDKVKHNLVRELGEAYGLNEFFGENVANFRLYEATYKILTHKLIDNPEEYYNAQKVVVEHLSTERKETLQSLNEDIDTDTQIVGLALATKSFNEKYNTLNENQKGVLRAYMASDDTQASLKQIVNEALQKTKKVLIKSKEDSSPELSNQLEEATKRIKIIEEKTNLIEEDIEKVLSLLELADALDG